MAEARNQQLRNLWADAAKAYNDEQKRSVEEYEKTHNHFWNIHKHKKSQALKVQVTSLEDFKKQVAKQDADFAEKRNRHHGVFKAMSAMGPAVEVIGGQAASLGSGAFPPAPMIFSAVMFLFHTGTAVSTTYDALEKLFIFCNNSIADIQQLVGVRRDIPTELQNAAIESLIAVLDVMRIAAERTEKARITDYLLAMAKPGEGGAELDALRKLKDLAKRLGTKVDIDTNVRAGRIEGTGTETLHQVLEVKTMIAMIKRRGDEAQPGTKTITKDSQQKLEEKRKNDLRDFLDPDTTITATIKSHVDSTAKGTCKWIFEEPAFKKWMNEPDSPFIWIHGPSGVGKSYLAASIVNYFKPSHLVGDKSNTKSKVAAYFCQYTHLEAEAEVAVQDKHAIQGPNTTKSGDQRPIPDDLDAPLISDAILEDTNPIEPSEIKYILQTLCWQLCEDDKDYEKDLIDHFDSVVAESGDNSSLVSTWECLFRRKILRDRFITFVIDGLDNLDNTERSRLLYLLRNVAQSINVNGLSNIKIVIFSQTSSISDARRLFPDFNIPSVAITEQKSREDIKKYIDWSISKSNRLSLALKDDAKRTSTIQKLASATKGVFEMCALLLKQLSQKDHVNLFSEIIQNPPKDIDAILRHTVEHFGETHTAQDINDLNSLISWVLYSEGYMTLAQLNAIIGIESDQGAFLDIRDKVGREFSAFFTIVDPPVKDVVEDSAATNPEKEPQVHTSDDTLDVSYVKFAHASIAKCCRSEISIQVKRKDNRLTVGSNKADANLRIARTCLLVICATKDTKPPVEDADKLLHYAANNFHKHLENCKDFAQSVENLDIAKNIIRLFRDETVMDRWFQQCQFSKIWLDPEQPNNGGNGTLETISAWLCTEAIRSRLDDDELTWLDAPCPSVAERFLKPAAIWFAKKWLVDPNPELNDASIYFFVYLNSLIQLFDHSANPTTSTTPLGDPYDEALKMDIDGIRKVAEWPNFPKVPLWYTRLGYNIGDIILDDSLNDLREYQEALKLDPNFAQTHFALGAAYGMRGLYDEAIEEMNESRRCNYGGDHDQRGLVFIAQWQLARSDPPKGVNEALQTLEEALVKYPDYFPATEAYIRIASEDGRNKAAMVKLRSLGPKMADFLRSINAPELHKVIRRIAQRTKGIGFLRKAYESAIATSIKLERAGKSAAFNLDDPDAPTNLPAQLLLAVGDIYTENQEEDEALKRYQRVLEIADRNDPDGPGFFAMNKMAQLYFTGAYSKERSGEERNANLQKLIQMEKEEHSTVTGISLLKTQPGLMLGLYYRMEGQLEKARAIFQDRIELGISLLEDEDADNDYQGWIIISSTLSKAGDKDNAIAAVALCLEDIRKLSLKMAGGDIETENESTSTMERDEQQGQETVTTAPHPSLLVTGDQASVTLQITPINRLPKSAGPNPLSAAPLAADSPASPTQTEVDEYPDTPWNLGTLDCPCNKPIEENQKGVWVCMMCIDISFCDDCFKLHQDDAIPYTWCDSSHEFGYCVGYPEGLPVTKVKVGGKIRDRKEWFEEIKKNWGVPRKVEEKAVPGLSKREKFLEKIGVNHE